MLNCVFEYCRAYRTACRPLAASVFVALLSIAAFSQSVSTVRSGAFRVGEKISYTVSFQNIKDVALFETGVASQGKIAGHDVVELRGRLKTFDIVSAAFSFIDEDRTVLADPVSGLPLTIDRTINSGPIPKQITSSFLAAPATSFDLLSALYAIRSGNGNGSFPILEDGETSILTAQTEKTQKIKTVIGEFDTSISTISGPYLDARGIKQFTIYFSIDEARLPVMIRFKTAKGVYEALISSVTNEIPEVAPSPTPTPTPVKPPGPTPTPKPVATPTPYIENQPLLPELGFALGESLEYRVTRAGKQVASVRLAAPERKLFAKRDGLKLTAMVTGIDQGNTAFVLGDSMTTIVNPDTLAPAQSELKFAGSLSRFTQTAVFDIRTGAIGFGGAQSTEAPVGTHSLLSLLYAMRSFNLRPSKDLGNHVNDTRVAVFWNDRPYIFTLRPNNPDLITIGGEALPPQLINFNTGNPELDQLAIKVWLSMDERRVPLRIIIGGYQADLVSATNTLKK